MTTRKHAGTDRAPQGPAPRDHPPSNLIEVVQIPAERWPERVALHFRGQLDGPDTLTWSDLWRRSMTQAGRLIEAGAEPGDRVLIVLPTSSAFVETLFGTLLAGAIPVPAAPPLSPKGAALAPYLDHLKDLAIDSGAAVCACQALTLEIFEAAFAECSPETRCLPAEGLNGCAATVPVPRPESSDTALIQYTSGSTGDPSGVVLTHGNLIANTAAIAEAVLPPDTVILSWLPLYHDMGLIGSLLSGLHARVPTTLMPPQSFIKNPASWLRGISDAKATITVAPNFAYDYCVRSVDVEKLDEIRLDTLRDALNGAEPVDPVAVRRFQTKFAPLGLRDWVVRPVYGLAESSVAVTFAESGPHVTDEIDADRLETLGEAVPVRDGGRRRRFISVGRPIPTQEVRIADEEGMSVPERRVGEILVRGPSVTHGYYERPRATAKVLRDGWLWTGDLGYQVDGRLFITGRSKDIIIRHGRNYYPEDIERQVARLEGARAGGVVAFDVADEAETRIVVVVETRLWRGESREELERSIRECIHNAFLFGPDEVQLLRPGAIPRTTSGKVRRRDCKQQYLTGELGKRRRRRAAAGTAQAQSATTIARAP